MDSVAAEIRCDVDGSPGTGDMPGRLIFKTTADAAQAATERMRINSAGNIGIGTDSPDGHLHVHTSTAGSVTAHASGDDLVIEGGTNPGMTILGPNDNTLSIFFGDQDSNISGQFNYSHPTDQFKWVTAGATKMSLGGAAGSAILDLETTGNRIDLDTDNDTSIRASADDTMVFELGGEDYFTMYNTGSSNTTATWEVDTIDRGITLELKVPSSANTGWMSFKFTEGAGDGTANDMGYTFSYGPSSDYFRFQSQDTNGSAATADIYRIPDGQLSIDANTTWDANVFDYVCGECGRHEAEKFSCCGPVAWHDDVALMDEVIHGVGKNKHVVEKLEKLGVVNTYGTLGTDKPELFTSLQKMPWFLMSGMVQMSNRIDELESRLEMN
jgi:hypothetical protein